jgi:hypothetical protein
MCSHKDMPYKVQVIMEAISYMINIAVEEWLGSEQRVISHTAWYSNKFG